MSMICGNPKCQHHKPMTSPDPQYCMVWGPLMPNGEQMKIKVQRFEYRNRFGALVFYLCDTCHNAAEMVRRGAA